MEERIAEFQDSLRKMGYPRLTAREIETTTSDSSGNRKINSRKQWEFTDKDHTASVVIDCDFIVYQVTDYTTFENYLVKLLEVLEVFESVAEPDLIQRVGLRYIDLITPSEGKNLDYYLGDRLDGLYIKPHEHEEAFRAESITQTGEESKFLHRFYRAPKGFAFPSDLLPTTLKFKRQLHLESPFGLLDLDHYITVDEDYSVESLRNYLCFLHERQSEAFEDSVSESAIDEWKEA